VLVSNGHPVGQTDMMHAIKLFRHRL